MQHHQCFAAEAQLAAGLTEQLQTLADYRMCNRGVNVQWVSHQTGFVAPGQAGAPHPWRVWCTLCRRRHPRLQPRFEEVISIVPQPPTDPGLSEGCAAKSESAA